MHTSRAHRPLQTRDPLPSTLPRPTYLPASNLPRLVHIGITTSSLSFFPLSFNPSIPTQSFSKRLCRICQSLIYVMGAMFFIGLCSQRCLRPLPKDVNNDGVTTSLEKQKSALFTPPRARSPLGASSARSSAHTLTRQDTCSTSSDFEIDDNQEASAGGQRQSGGEGGDKAAGRRQGNEKKGFREYDEDEAFILGIGGRRGRAPGAWERVSAGTRRSVHTSRPFRVIELLVCSVRELLVVVDAKGTAVQPACWSHRGNTCPPRTSRWQTGEDN